MTHSFRTGSDGTLRHDGDCYIYAVGVCTCGLIHMLCPMDGVEAAKLLPKCEEQIGTHYRALEHLRVSPPKEPTPRELEDAAKLLGILFPKDS